MTIRERLANLINVKTIITFCITGVICYLAIAGKIEAEKIYSLALMIISFYFGTQKEKKDGEDKSAGK